MPGLYIALALLGLSTIDPIGIGIMPVLLIQKRPYVRALAFLGGSFVSLMLMGILFAEGFGRLVLHFEHRDHRFVPVIEIIGSIILLIIALVLYIQFRKGKLNVEPSGKVRRYLQFGDITIFSMGAILVAIQSIIDVIFVVAMVRVGQLQLSFIRLFFAILAYTIAALLPQTAVVVAFKMAPEKQKDLTLQKVHNLLEKYANKALIIVSLGLSCLLIILAALSK